MLGVALFVQMECLVRNGCLLEGRLPKGLKLGFETVRCRRQIMRIESHQVSNEVRLAWWGRLEVIGRYLRVMTCTERRQSGNDAGTYHSCCQRYSEKGGLCQGAA